MAMVWPPSCGTGAGSVCDDGMPTKLMLPGTSACTGGGGGGATKKGSRAEELVVVKSGLYDTAHDEMVEVALECDYEKNCTRLYKSIEQEDWGFAASFLDTGYWPGHFFPDTMSPSDQVKAWVTRFDKKKEDDDDNEDYVQDIKWSQLPLHLAIVVDAPLGVIRRLVEHYPRGVQCTDDQNMLPLHLALRQGAADDIVDYLLKVFPAAVNAKGKNGRSALECAMRSRRKARARIMMTFLEQSRTYEAQELQSILSRLEDRNNVIDGLQTKLYAIEENRSIIEVDLASEITRLEGIKNNLEFKLQSMERTMDEKVTKVDRQMDEQANKNLKYDLDVQKKIMALEESARELELAEIQARQEGESLAQNLGKLEATIVQSFSEDDLVVLKKEVKDMKSKHLKETRAKTLREIENLKKSLTKNIQSEGGNKTDEELTAMKETLAALQSKDFELEGGTDGVNNLRSELRMLKDELRAKRELGRTKSEIGVLQKMVQEELKTPNGKGDRELLKVQTTVDKMATEELTHKNPGELLDVRKEVAIMKKRVHERQLINQMESDLKVLLSAVDRQLEVATNSERKRGLVEVKKAIEKITRQNLENKSNEELLDLKMEMIALKDALKEKEATYKLNLEVVALKNEIDEAIKASSNNKKKKELAALKKSVESNERTKPASASLNSMLLLKKKFQDLKQSYVTKSEVIKVKEESALMKRMLTQQISENSGDIKSRKELAEMKKTVDTLHAKKFEKMGRDEFGEVKLELILLWKKMAETEETLKVKEDLASLKSDLDRDMRNIRDFDRSEFMVMKHTIDEINLDDVDAKDMKNWRTLKTELEAVKLDLKKKEMKALKQVLERELKVPGNKSKADIRALREASNRINLVEVETATMPKLIEMKERADEALAKSTRFGTKNKAQKKKGGLRAMLKFGVKPTTDSLTTNVPVVSPPRVGGPTLSADSSEDSESNNTTPKTAYSKTYGNVTKTYGGSKASQHQPESNKIEVTFEQ